MAVTFEGRPDNEPERLLAAPIFIGGTGRSGTTVTARMMSAHPNIFALRWETQFIVANNGLIDLARSGYDSAALERFLKQLRGRWFRRVLNPGTPREYTAGLFHDVSEDDLEHAIGLLNAAIRDHRDANDLGLAAGFISALFANRTIDEGAHRWCEKTPRSIFYIAELNRMFPDMKFVHVIRDGRDVAWSMTRRNFWPIAPTAEVPATERFKGEVTFELALDYWKEMLALARASAAQVAPENYLEIRLEDLVQDKEATLRRLVDFLGEPLDPALLDFQLKDSAVGRFRNELSDDQMKEAAKRIGDALEAEGYRL